MQKLIPAIGISVVKAAQNLPQTATAALFTVSGGAVLVTSLFGLVTTNLGATVTNLSLGTAVVGDSNASIIAATAIASKNAGTIVAPQPGSNGAPAAAPFMGNAAFINMVPLSESAFLLAANITWTTSASNTGQMKWYLTYIPLDQGASVS